MPAPALSRSRSDGQQQAYSYEPIGVNATAGKTASLATPVRKYTGTILDQLLKDSERKSSVSSSNSNSNSQMPPPLPRSEHASKKLFASDDSPKQQKQQQQQTGNQQGSPTSTATSTSTAKAKATEQATTYSSNNPFAPKPVSSSAGRSNQNQNQNHVDTISYGGTRYANLYKPMGDQSRKPSPGQLRGTDDFVRTRRQQHGSKISSNNSSNSASATNKRLGGRSAKITTATTINSSGSSSSSSVYGPGSKGRTNTYDSSGGNRPLKIIIIGNAGVGKTNLLKVAIDCENGYSDAHQVCVIAFVLKN
jgi:hypothetical protein